MITSRERAGPLSSPPPTPATPRSSGEEVGKILQGLGKVPWRGGGEGAGLGIPAVACTGQSERSCHPSPSPWRRNDPISGQGGGFRGQSGDGPRSPEPSLGTYCGKKKKTNKQTTKPIPGGLQDPTEGAAGQAASPVARGIQFS